MARPQEELVRPKVAQDECAWKLRCGPICGPLNTRSGHPRGCCVRHEPPHIHGCSWRSRTMSRTLIIIGLLIVAIGVLWPWLGRLGLGRLPGDFVIRREGFTLYAPIATGLIISIVLSVIFWLFRR